MKLPRQVFKLFFFPDGTGQSSCVGIGLITKEGSVLPHPAEIRISMRIFFESVIIYFTDILGYTNLSYINFQSSSKFSTLYVFFIVRICKVDPSPGVTAAVPV